MTLDLLIPFGILFALVIYLIFTRSRFEKEIVSTYEEKFDNWKKHHTTEQEPQSCKELVGLIFRKDGKIECELYDEMVQHRLQKGKYTTKVQ